MATGDTASDPLLAAVTKRGEEGSLTFTKDSKILARSAGTRQRHHQRAQPGTRPGCLRNQAVNIGTTTYCPICASCRAGSRRWCFAGMGQDLFPAVAGFLA